MALRAPGEWHPRAPGAAARELTLELRGVTLFGLVYDDPDDATPGFDTLLVSPERRVASGVALKPLPTGDREALQTVVVDGEWGPAAVHLRLFELGAETGDLLVWGSTPYPLRSNHRLAAEAALEATGGFLGNAASGAYRRGLFGRTLWDGGDGLAEERYLEIVAHVIERFRRLDDFCFDRTAWSLLVTYLPYPDEAFHLWLGFLEEELPGHDPELARRLLPYLDRVLGMVDGRIGHLAERVGPEGVLAIGSDHGQIGSRREVRPNRVLLDAGLLATAIDDRVDLARTRALYHAGNSGRVVVNLAGRPGGVVRRPDVDGVLEAAAAALGAALDPDTMEPLFTEVRRVDDEIELVAAPGYYASPRTRGGVAGERRTAGVHLFGPEREEMHASFALWGDGVAPGADLGVIRQVDVAPTLAALLGLEPPRDAQGVVLDAALLPGRDGRAQPADTSSMKAFRRRRSSSDISTNSMPRS